MLSKKIDEVSDILERKGFLREAAELDSIANAIDKMAYMAKGRPPYSKHFPLVYKGVGEILDRLKIGNDKKIDSIVQFTLTELKPVKDEFQILKKGIFKDGPDDYIEDSLSYLDKLENSIKKRDANGLSEFHNTGYQNFVKAWDENTARIHEKQMSYMGMPTGTKPF